MVPTAYPTERSTELVGGVGLSTRSTAPSGSAERHGRQVVAREQGEAKLALLEGSKEQGARRRLQVGNVTTDEERDAVACCMSMDVSCLACKDGIAAEDYCTAHPATDGCTGTESGALLVVLVVAGIGLFVVGCYCLGFGLMNKEVERAEEEAGP